MARFQAGPIKGFCVLPLSTSILLFFALKKFHKELKKLNGKSPVTSSRYLDFLVLSLIFLTMIQFLNQEADIKLLIPVVNKNPPIHTVKALNKFKISKDPSSGGFRDFKTPHIVPVDRLSVVKSMR
jgi:hypothetical protein